jgi:hypothetical protein
MQDKRKDHGKPGVLIYINTHEFLVDDKELGYDEVIRLAFPEGPFSEEWVYTVTYSFAHGGGGELVAGGESVKVKKEMSFVVGRSNRS